MNYQILISETFYNIFMFFVNVNEGKDSRIMRVASIRVTHRIPFKGLGNGDKIISE